jgi:hypothetical protein
MALRGILMAAIPWSLVTAMLAIVAVFLLTIDGLKVQIFRRFGVR